MTVDPILLGRAAGSLFIVGTVLFVFAVAYVAILGIQRIHLASVAVEALAALAFLGSWRSGYRAMSLLAQRTEGPTAVAKRAAQATYLQNQETFLWVGVVLTVVAVVLGIAVSA